MDYSPSLISFLISTVHSHTSSFLKKRLKEEGLEALASSHGYLLFQLSSEDQLTMSELSKKINKDKSTTTALCKKLEDMGFIERNQCSVDKRQTYIRLSEKGRSYEKNLERISQELIQTALNGFSNSEEKEIIELLSRIKNNFQKISFD